MNGTAVDAAAQLAVERAVVSWLVGGCFDVAAVVRILAVASPLWFVSPAHAAVFTAAKELREGGVDVDLANLSSVLRSRGTLDREFLAQLDAAWDNGDLEADLSTLQRAYEQRLESIPVEVANPEEPPAPGDEERVLDPKDPLAIARRFIADYHTRGGLPTIYAWRGDIRMWTGRSYPAIEDAAMRSAVYGYLETAKRSSGDPFRPNAAAVSNVLDALRGAAHLNETLRAPRWLDRRSTPAATEIISVENGLLHLPTRTLMDHTPAAFVTTELPYKYDRNALEPAEWLRFLDSLWPNDQESIDAVQEAFGYLISGETRHQKAFLIVGPKRSGKGTIGRVLRALIGPDNVAGPTLTSLAGNFGLQSLIDKPVAIISDARLSSRADQAVITERLLSITGEDWQTVDRKHRDAWNGFLPTRFVILTNELPKLSDMSGALAGRFVILTMQHSWFGHEDLTLFDRIEPELASILLWALDGYDRLRTRGHFQMPQSSDDAVRELNELGSPVGTFVTEQCITQAGAEVMTSVLYGRWKKWCEDRGATHVSTEAVFGRDLRAVVPGIVTADRRSSGERFRVFVGIRLREG